VVATVNGEDITRQQLAKECLLHYGSEVLESMVNKHLIEAECRRRGVTVTQEEVRAEIERLARRFGLPVDQWLKMLHQERGIHPAQYAQDIIWPTLALRKLASNQLIITPEEINREFQARYGPAVKVRLIVLDHAATAQKVHREAKEHPERFGQLARQHSVDVGSAAANGLIHPVRRYAGHPRLEEVAFSLAEGQISEVFEVDGQYVILKCEGQLPAQNVALEEVKMRLVEGLRDSKMRKVAEKVFRQLQQEAKVVNVFNDPVKRRQFPGVAALVNGQRITIQQLAEECIRRHGEEVLEGTINRLLLEQACRKQKITITEKDLDEEIASAAAIMVKSKPDGSPDVETWLKLVTEKQGVSEEVYRRDSVWPTVALKKLVGDQIEVTEEDLQKGFEANYGPRVRCLAIVLDNARRAFKVWEMARKNPTPEHFGDLAEQYSIEPTSRSLRGEVPPIQKHGGQPTLEKEAFALKANELSGVIQVGPERYVILYCLGRTEPVAVEFEAVKQYLYEDIYEKKERLAMAKVFRQLQQGATIDNFLASTSHRPSRQTGLRTAARRTNPSTRR